jgi:hypothetical protein
MAFAPLFEEERQKNVDKFFRMVSKPVEQVDILPNVRSSGRSGIKNEIPDLSTILGLPELPFEAATKSPTISGLTFDDDDNNEIDYDEYSENGKLQLLPKKSAGKSVARFHKDREQPEQRLVPPPLPSSQPTRPLQVVGHVLDSEDLVLILFHYSSLEY